MNKTYRVRKPFKIISIILSLFFLFILVGMFAGPGIFRDPIKWLYHTIALVGESMWLWLLIFLAIYIFFAILIYRSTQYSVIVTPASITINAPFYARGPSLKGGMYNTIQYTDITRAVYVRFPKSIRIYSRTHVTRVIPLSSLEDKDELLAAIKTQLGEKFVVTKKSIDPLFLSQIVSMVMMVVIFLTWIIEPFDFAFVWTPVIEKPWLTSINVRAYSLDEDGQSTWIIDRKSFSDTYRILKVADKSIKSWENLPSDYFNTQVSHDGEGNPIAIKEDETVHWQDDEWKRIPFEREKIRFSWRGRPTVQGAKFWGSASFDGNKNHEIIGLDFVSSQSEQISLPPGMEENWLSNVQVNNDGSLLVEMKVDEAKWLFVYRNGQWIEPGYPLEKGTWMFDPIDFCVDAEGNLWILQGFSNGFRVGRFSTEKNDWDWFSLNSVSKGGERYSALQVDQRGRVWLQGDIDYDDFVRVYEALPKSLYELVEYNEYNSNLKTDFLITLGADGKMWVAGDNVAYIDSNAPTLPKPAPDWLAVLNTLTGRFVILLFYLCATIFLIGTQMVILRNKQ